MTTNPSLKVKIQLYCSEEVAMGPGKADLLDAIGREGSISGAGRAIGMSYRRAWLLVDVMNRCWKEPLVATVAGGGRERGARVTTFGHQVLAHYRALQGRIDSAAHCPDREALAESMLQSPRASD